MLTLGQRIVLFLVACIGLRTLFVVLAKNASPKNLRLLGILALLPVIGWAYIISTGSRKTGAEAGGKIWWDSLRPIHMTLYALFAVSAIYGNKNAWIFLLIDVMFGLMSFIIHHYRNGDFAKLL
jgi:hypothetical protein